jgi:hypothetical protein
MAVLLYHGLMRRYWELAKAQGALRRGRYEDRGDGYRWIIVGRGGVQWFTPDIRIAAVYAGGEIAKRYPRWPHGRWGLPNGIANQNGVIVACEFDPAEVTARSDRTQLEISTDIPISRLTEVAFIRQGHNVHAEARRCAAVPPPPPDIAAWVAKYRRCRALEIRGIRTPVAP